jgi:hypothetical protein
VRGLGDSPTKRDFLRSASAYFGHEVPEEEEQAPAKAARQQQQQQQQPAEAPAPSSSRPLSSQHAANERRLAAFRAFEEPKAFRKGLSAAEAPPYTTFPNITHGYRSGGTYLRCLASLVSCSFSSFVSSCSRRRAPRRHTKKTLDAHTTFSPPKTNKNNNTTKQQQQRTVRAPHRDLQRLDHHRRQRHQRHDVRPDPEARAGDDAA